MRDSGAPEDAGGSDGGFERDGGVERDGGFVRDGGVPDSGRPPLVEQGLVVRYFLDEASSGTAPMALDTGRPPYLDLFLSPSGSGPVYASAASGRSIRWTNAGVGGGFIASASNKIFNQLDGSREVTVEVVVDLDDADSSGSRLFHIGSGSTTDLGLMITNGSVIFPVNGSYSIEWNLQVGNLSGPTVLTVVFDSSRFNINDRIDFFVNGSRGPTSQIGPAPNVAFDFGPGTDVVIGNRPSGSRSIDGDIGYVAVYDRALSSLEVAANAAALLVSHDTR